MKNIEAKWGRGKGQMFTLNEASACASSASFLDIDTTGQLSTRFYNKREDFNFTIIP